MGVSLTILNPQGAVTGAEPFHASPRLRDLAGKKIGILNNGKAGGLMLLPFLKEALERNHPGIEIRQWEVPLASAEEAKEPVLDEMARQSDGVIALMGD